MAVASRGLKLLTVAGAAAAGTASLTSESLPLMGGTDTDETSGCVVEQPNRLQSVYIVAWVLMGMVLGCAVCGTAAFVRARSKRRRRRRGDFVGGGADTVRPPPAVVSSAPPVTASLREFPQSALVDEKHQTASSSSTGGGDSNCRVFESMTALLQEIVDGGSPKPEVAAALVPQLEAVEFQWKMPGISADLGMYEDGELQIKEYLMHVFNPASNNAADHSLEHQAKRAAELSEHLSGATLIKAGDVAVPEKEPASRRAALLPSTSESDGIAVLEASGALSRAKDGTAEEQLPFLSKFKSHAERQDLMSLLQPLGDSYFCNVLCLAEPTYRRPLVTVTFYILDKFKIVENLCLDRQKLFRFLSAIEGGYVEGMPFHNMYHAADVVQRYASILNKFGLIARGGLENKLRCLAAILAAAVHDFNHPGTNNAFVVANQTYLAKTYNDQSVLEHHSIRMALDMLHDPSMDFLSESRVSTRSDWLTLRRLMTSYVLATDMSQHFDLLAKFRLEFMGPTTRSVADVLKTSSNLDLLFQMCLKCADIGHCSMRIAPHLHWTKNLEHEFFAQGDLERLAGFPVSPLMDRSKSGVSHPGNQTGFLDVIVLPLYKAMTRLYPQFQPVLLQTQLNRDFWKRRAQDPLFRTESAEYYLSMVTECFEETWTIEEPANMYQELFICSRTLDVVDELAVPNKRNSSMDRSFTLTGALPRRLTYHGNNDIH